MSLETALCRQVVNKLNDLGVNVQTTPLLWREGLAAVLWLLLCRKAVKEQLNTLGVNTQIKALIKEGKQGAQKGPSGKGSGFTKEQAIEELKVCACMRIA